MAKPKRRMVSPGIYVSGDPPYGQLELDVPELLEHLGLEDTEDNRDMLVDLGEMACQQAGLTTKATLIEHTHKHICPGHHEAGHPKPWQHRGKRKQCSLGKRAFCPSCAS